ncbi:MAG: Na+/H+ antiporter NhaA, partial [Ginsengibacter sp.]
MEKKLSTVFYEFYENAKGGILLIVCTIISLLLTNSSIQESYLGIWHYSFSGLTIEQWINDGLMAIFFLLIGLELKREVMVGELSNRKNALLPVIAAIGGMIVPAGIYAL